MIYYYPCYLRLGEEEEFQNCMSKVVWNNSRLYVYAKTGFHSPPVNKTSKIKVFVCLRCLHYISENDHEKIRKN